MTEEYNCLPLKHIFNSSTENLLEHSVFVQVLTAFDQNNKCGGELNISEALQPLVSTMQGTYLNARVVCLFFHMDTACFICRVHIMLQTLQLCLFIIPEIMFLCP